MNIAPVGTPTLGAGLWGQLDMAGEVYEFNIDWFYVAYADPCSDCAYLSNTSSNRVGRSGSFLSPAAQLLPTHRGYGAPTDRLTTIGFRCARTP